MANFRAFHAVGEALRVYLNTTYSQTALAVEFPCSFQLLSTGQLANFEDPADSSVACTLFLYRVTISEQLRNALQPGRAQPPLQPALPVELHWMLSVWATAAAAEQIVLAWAMQQLNRQPLLDTGMLLGADFEPGDVVQVIPEELPLEGVMRVWESLEPSYRLSATYVTRIVRLDMQDAQPPPVVAIRLSVGTRDERELPA